MSSKQKAKEIYNKFYEASDGVGIPLYQSKVEIAKKSALIAVDEILDLHEDIPTMPQVSKDYWNEVKNHLKQL